jgi:signal transduction histidine kinase
MFRLKGARGNLVIVEKPVRPLSLRSAVDAALMTRTRQYELRDYQAELRALTAKLIEAQEAEGKHLARELHDDFGQKLAVLGMEMAGLADRASSRDKELGGPLMEFTARIGTFAKDIHHISRRLHPAILDDLGLAVALKNECAAFSEQHGIPAEFDPYAITGPVPDDISLCLYRVAQECLRNVGKHARAAHVRIALSGGRDEIAMEIADAGKGFDLERIKGKGRLGLISMEERVRLVNGAFSIRSQPGKGTLVKVRVPLRQRAS